MLDPQEDVATDRANQLTFLGIAAGLHLLLLLWNPTLFRQIFKSVSPPWIVIDLPEPTGPATPDSSLRPSGHTITRAMGSLFPHHAPSLPFTGPSSQIPINLEKPSSPRVAGTHWTSRPFQGIRPSELPFATEPRSIDRQAIPIVIGTGGKAPQSQISRPGLVAPRIRSAIVDPSGAIGSRNGPDLIEQGTGGHPHSIGIPDIPAAAPMDVSQSALAHSESRKNPRIVGPLSHRGVLRRIIPEYPAWAEEQGITATVRLYFTVNAEGAVRSTIRVDQTSGYPELDRITIDALRRWQFSTVPGADDDQQWGIITFTFALTNH